MTKLSIDNRLALIGGRRPLHTMYGLIKFWNQLVLLMLPNMHLFHIPPFGQF